jgi:ElaB/YqjD/DUF883 family membrane-anchored ribosome-binding protein
MGEDPRAGGTQVTSDRTREPEEIRRDIESTRGDLGDTVQALSEKADVRSQAQRRVAEVRRSVDAKKDELLGKARRASPDGASSAASTVGQKARENPLPVAVAGAFAAGLLVGRIINR